MEIHPGNENNTSKLNSIFREAREKWITDKYINKIFAKPQLIKRKFIQINL
jgi:hypothetical protein